ncbi:aminodeoxychorismate synthase component I [Caryophanon latum]|uniref:Aminodeoxychorismate synthase, component I n=1 Tax=Caryophanon latum TaxID=33977 RepID=A0A1C0YEG2_9BACL|nr:aminodeoxychorismate synthase component I [Caryophanon latum]OCS85550.1 aminodeoxychorismate synthase, component I [Caryophanon latum]
MTFIHLKFPQQDGKLQSLTFKEPIATLTAHSLQDVEQTLREVERYTNDGHYAAGYVSYEAGAAFDAAMPVRTDGSMPYLSFSIFREPTNEDIFSEAPFALCNMTPSISKDTYNEAIATIHNEIYEGNTYQTNYTLRLHGTFEGDAKALYTKLQRAQQANYCAYMEQDDYTIVCASPELFFNKTGQTLTTKPMKGTVARGLTVEEDEAQAKWLYTSEKNRAENVMIVDLLRNDVSKVATAGSVRVDELFTIERYPTVHQMTSTVRATLREQTTITDLFKALFPCGSITGAPKVKTMQLIQALEPTPRDIYCGAIGFIAPNGDATFNVAIRTLLLKGTDATYGVGGGITWDSTAKAEFDEVLAKSHVLTADAPVFDLLETLLLEDGHYYLLDEHMARLQASADYFQRPIDVAHIIEDLRAVATKHAQHVWRVRLVVSPTSHTIEAFPLTLTDAPMRVALADAPIDQNSRFFYYKTTHRAAFTAFQQQYADFDDVLLWNERGELTEFTNGNVVLEIDDALYTPYVSAGLLNGTFRAHLIATHKITEKVLTKEHLQQATNVWFINSVRKWRRVMLTP